MAGWLRPFASALAEYGPNRTAMIERYWNDKDYASSVDAERDQWRRDTNTLIDKAMEQIRARQLARWEAEEAAMNRSFTLENRNG